MISRFAATAPRVANPIAIAIATIMSANRAQGENDNGVGHRPDAGGPYPSIAEGGLRSRMRQRGAQPGQVVFSAALHVDDEDPRNGQRAEIESVAQPGLQQFPRIGRRIGADVFDPSRLRRDGDDLGDEAFDVVPGVRLHLDRDFPQNVGSPALRGLRQEQGAAGGQTRQESHDGDDGRQRASGDRTPAE